MKLPTEPKDLSHCFVIDKLSDGVVFFLWSVQDDEWACMKTGSIRDVLKKLEELTHAMR